jgi:hypothetical protein
MRKRFQHRRGYVLLLTLALVTLAAITMTGLARHSLKLALEAQDAERELQERWGAISCRRVLLDRADELFEALVPEEQVDRPPWPKPAIVEAEFTLRDSLYWIRLADEDAKANLNVIHEKKPQRLLELLRTQAIRDGSGMMPIRLRAWANDPAQRASFTSWGQVFDLASFPPHVEAPLVIANQTTTFTCWGSGKLNFRRASDQAVDAVAGLVLEKSEVAELLELRQDWSETTLRDMLNDLDVRGVKLAQLRTLLTDDTTSYSLWTRVETPHRTQVSLAVSNPGSPFTGDILQFTW